MTIDNTDWRSAMASRDRLPAFGATAHGFRQSVAGAAGAQPIGALMAQVYESAPLPLRAQLVEQMLAPMSVYALISVAGGVFASIRGRNAEWQGFRVGVQDIEGVGAREVAALAERVLPANGAAGERVGQLIARSPALASSVAGSALLTLLLLGRRPQRPAVAQAQDVPA